MSLQKRILVATVASLAALVVTGVSTASAPPSPTLAICSKAPDGSGFMNGGYQGFRAAGGSVQLINSASGFAISASTKTASCACVGAGGTPMAAAAASLAPALAQNGAFAVGFNAAGTCTTFAAEVASTF